MRGWRWAASVGAVLVGSSVGLPARSAFACSWSPPVPVPTDPAKVGLDSRPPVVFDVIFDSIERAPVNPDNPCTDRMFLLVLAEDDQAPREKLRYRVEDTSTKEPYFIFDEPVPYFFLLPPYAADLHLRIYALDEAGNQSAPFAFSMDQLGEDEDEGCSMSHAGTTPGASTLAGGLLVALAWLGRRRTRDHAMTSLGARSGARAR